MKSTIGLMTIPQTGENSRPYWPILAILTSTGPTSRKTTASPVTLKLQIWQMLGVSPNVSATTYPLGSTNIAGWKYGPFGLSRCISGFENEDMPASYVSLPEGISSFMVQFFTQQFLYLLIKIG